MKAWLRLLLFSGLALKLNTLHAQLPVLNSYPEATAVIYLDFDGEYVSGTSWNWYGPIDAAPATASAVQITETFNRVAEDFRPFNVNITTDLNVFQSAPGNQRMRVILTPTYSWYGRAGGVAFINSFIWGDDTPCWVFSSLLGNDPKFLAEAVSHEVGHTLALQHQSEYDAVCNKVQEYSEGRGEGEIGWAPIMGVGYYKNHTTWNIGTNAVSCSRIQNDISMIATRLGVRTDDHAGSVDSATTVTFSGMNFNVSGLINQSGDADIFKIDIPLNSNLKLDAIPKNVGSGNQGANVDIRVSILNESMDTIGDYNPSNQLDAGIDTSLNSGRYYVVVRGVGNINHSDYGSIGYYSLNGAMLQVLPLRKFILRGGSNKGFHELNWSYQADENVRKIEIQSSADGKKFQQLTDLSGSTMKFKYEPLTGSVYYRLKAVMDGGEHFYSNIIFIKKDAADGVQIMSGVVNTHIRLTCSASTDYILYEPGGRILSKGKLQQGTNQLSVQYASRGIILLSLNDGTGARTEKLIKP